jgi:hypothetical protein
MSQRVETAEEARRHLGAAALGIVAMIAVAYLVPTFERFRPWRRGPDEPIPMSTLFRSWRERPSAPR